MTIFMKIKICLILVTIKKTQNLIGKMKDKVKGKIIKNQKESIKMLNNIRQQKC